MLSFLIFSLGRVCAGISPKQNRISLTKYVQAPRIGLDPYL